MKRTLALLALLSLLTSACSSYRVTQSDTSDSGRRITLDLRANAWFSSAQAITKIKALQTDKSQSFGTDNIGQQGSTNSLKALEYLVRIAEATK